MKIECPVCGDEVENVHPGELVDETGVEITTASGGEIVGIEDRRVVEYEFRPCMHTALETERYPGDT